MTGRSPERPEDRRLSPSEVRAYLDAPLSDAERDGVRELVRWFLPRWRRTRWGCKPRGGA
jgi:hypothetical protein